MKYLDTNYVFDASAQTVQILTWPSGTLKKEWLLIITNVVDGIIIYNFADPAKGGTVTPDAGGDIITLEYDTTSMSDTDELQIFLDDDQYPASDAVLASLALESGGNLDSIRTALEGTLTIEDGGGSITVDGTITIQDGGNVISVDDGGGNISIDDGGNSITVDAPVGTPVFVRLSDGSSAIATLPVSLATVPSHAVTNAGTFATQVDGAALTSLQLIDDPVKTDDAGFTPATDKVMMMGAQLDDTSPDSVDEGDAGAVRMSANRSLHVRIRDNAGNERGLNIDANGEPGISAIRSALPAGTNAIGKLAANSGVDIGDVDVTSVPADPFGVNADAASATGSISAKLRFIASTGIPVTGTVTVGSHAVTNAGTFVTQENGAALTSLQLVDDVVFVDDAAFTPGTSKVNSIGLIADETATDSVDEGDIGAPRMTLDRKQITVNYSHTTGGWTPGRILSANTTNATSVKGSAGQIGYIHAINLNAAVRYLKIYNKATSPTVGTDTPVQTFPIPASTTGAGFVFQPTPGMDLTTGIGMAITTGIADADTGAVASNEIIINYGYK